MRYKIGQTIPKILLGGLKKGLVKPSYQTGNLLAVAAAPIIPAPKGASMLMESFSKSIFIIHFYLTTTIGVFSIISMLYLI